jgi:deoxyribonuclease (pyrimidine dimer)
MSAVQYNEPDIKTTLQHGGHTMTRINCVPVSELTDKHLLAEYREIGRIAALANKSKPREVPAKYLLGKGHVLFFYNKGQWLKNRFEQDIVPEMKKRGFKPNFTEYPKINQELMGNWTPNEEAMAINRKRISDRLSGIKD